jgi:hypothetical protein
VRTLSWQGAHVVESLGVVAPSMKSAQSPDGSRRFTDPHTIHDIEALVTSLVAAAGQRPSARFAAVTRLAIDAGVDPAPLADHLGAQDDAWSGHDPGRG